MSCDSSQASWREISRRSRRQQNAQVLQFTVVLSDQNRDQLNQLLAIAAPASATGQEGDGEAKGDDGQIVAASSVPTAPPLDDDEAEKLLNAIRARRIIRNHNQGPCWAVCLTIVAYSLVMCMFGYVAVLAFFVPHARRDAVVTEWVRSSHMMATLARLTDGDGGCDCPIPAHESNIMYLLEMFKHYTHDHTSRITDVTGRVALQLARMLNLQPDGLDSDLPVQFADPRLDPGFEMGVCVLSLFVVWLVLAVFANITLVFFEFVTRQCPDQKWSGPVMYVVGSCAMHECILLTTPELQTRSSSGLLEDTFIYNRHIMLMFGVTDVDTQHYTNRWVLLPINAAIVALSLLHAILISYVCTIDASRSMTKVSEIMKEYWNQNRMCDVTESKADALIRALSRVTSVDGIERAVLNAKLRDAHRRVEAAMAATGTGRWVWTVLCDAMRWAWKPVDMLCFNMWRGFYVRAMFMIRPQLHVYGTVDAWQ